MSKIHKKKPALHKKFAYLIGAAGVENTENLLAKRAGLIFELPMLLAALWLMMNWWGQSQGDISQQQATHYDIILWGLFVIESSLLAYLVNNTKRYLLNNWLNMVIIVLGIPLLFGLPVYFGVLRLLRLMIVFSLLIHVGNRIKKMLSRNELGTTLIASAMVIIMAGVMIDVLEPGIKSPADGIWWAWVTVTTVGYGDIVPESNLGRVFASFIILLGIGLFSMITATFAAYFISQKEDEFMDEEREHYRRICEMDDRLIRLEEKLDELMTHNKNE